jgi:hypothetical protein
MPSDQKVMCPAIVRINVAGEPLGPLLVVGDAP